MVDLDGQYCAPPSTSVFTASEMTVRRLAGTSPKAAIQLDGCQAMSSEKERK